MRVRYVWSVCFCLYVHIMIVVPIDNCRVLYKYYITTQDREHKPVTDSILSILEVGDSITQYGDLTKYVFLNRENLETIKALSRICLASVSTPTPPVIRIWGTGA